MTEVWREIKGFEGLYEISNYGRVRSVDKVVPQMSRWGSVVNRRWEGKILSPFDNGHGYMIVGLRKTGGKRKNYYVHRLVAETFIDNPLALSCVNHLDYDRANNRVDNLEWCTYQENVLYSTERMKKQHKSKLPVTGEKYVILRNGRYELTINKRYIGSYKTVEEAVSIRNELVKVVN